MGIAAQVAHRWRQWPAATMSPARGASRDGGPFLPALFGGAGRQMVEMAFGADLNADPDTWSWTDVTTYFLWDAGVNISAGRSPESTRITPATMSGTIRNDQPNGGEWTVGNALSPRWPYVRENTPIRTRLDIGNGPTVRFQGYAVSWKPSVLAIDDSGDRISVVLFRAAGVARRLFQGASAEQSPLRRALTASSPAAYWPLEEGPAASDVSSVKGAAISLVRLMATGPAEFGAVTPLTGATVMPSFIRGGALDLQVASAVASAWTVQFALFFGTGQPAEADYTTPSAMNVLKLYATDGDYWLFQLSPFNTFYSTGRIALFRSDEAELFFDTLVDVPLGTFDPWDGQTHHVAITASQSGGNIAWSLILDGAVLQSGTLVGRTLKSVNLARLNQNGFLASSSTYGLGHFAVHESVIDVTDFADAAAGHRGEVATVRMARLADEANIPLEIVGTSDIAMGAQRAGGVFDLIQDCEQADSGTLFDGLGPGLTYVCRASGYSKAAGLTLDAGAGDVIVLDAEHDDLGRVNTYTARSPAGAEQTFTKETGDLGSDVVGVYDSSGLFNVDLDATLYDEAAWKVNLGTVPGLRYPGVSFQLAKPGTSVLAQRWLDSRPFDRLDILDVTPGGIDPDGEFLLRSWMEKWTSLFWSVTASLSPYAPWGIATLADATGDHSEFLFRASGGYSTLAADVAAGATSLSVATSSGAVWSTVADDIDGLYIEAAGLRIAVTNIAGASSPQTFTVTGSTVLKAISSGTSIDIWQAPVLGL
jgi:hypothetical protein